MIEREIELICPTSGKSVRRRVAASLCPKRTQAVGACRREQRHRRHIDRHRVRRAILGEQGGCDQRREAAAEDRAELLHQRQAAIADAGREQLGEIGALRAVDRAVADSEAERDREPNHRSVRGVQYLEEHQRQRDLEDHAADIDRAASDSIRQRAEQRQRQAFECAADEDAVEDGLARQPKLGLAIGDGKHGVDVEEPALGDLGADAEDDIADVAAHRLDDGHAGRAFLRQHALERRASRRCGSG